MTQEHAGLRVSFSRDLNFFLAREQEKSVGYDLLRRASVKDIIESLGVPHTEVGHILFNGTDIGFDVIPEMPGHLQVSGISRPFNPLAASRLRPYPLPILRFVADLNVIKLGRYLLALGYDTVLAREESDSQIADLAADTQRIVLTRDTRLLFRKKICFARRIHSAMPLEQLRETIDFFGLVPDSECFFSRCARCNCLLTSVEKADIFHLLEPKTRKYVRKFRRCPVCGQIFWEGSHYQALRKKFESLGILKQVS